MGTLNEKLAYLKETKAAIKAAIVEKGQTVEDTDTFRSYAEKIAAFNVPTLLEGVEITLDFSDGDITLEAEDGTAIKSAIIKKPENLEPENIAKDEIVAGIAGTHEGGGDQPQLYAPTIARSGTTVTVANPASNGDFVSSYKIYDGEDLIAEQAAKTLDISGFALGTHMLTAIASGENFVDSAASAALNASRYSVTLTLENLTSDFSGDYVWHGDSLIINLSTSSDSLALPKEIEATMNGSAEGIQYSADDKKITISSVTGNVEIAISAIEILTLEDTPWEMVAEYAENGTIADKFAVGDTKNLTLNFEDGTTTTIAMKIAAFAKDDLADGSGKAGVTFIAERALMPEEMYSHPSDRTWKSTIQRTWLNEGYIYNALPSTVQERLKTVTKHHSGGTYNAPAASSSEDKVWVPSLSEVGLSCGYAIDMDVEAYPIFTNDTSRKRLGTGKYASYYVLYLLRDKHTEYSYQMCAVANDGTASDVSMNVSTHSKGTMLIGFCL